MSRHLASQVKTNSRQANIIGPVALVDLNFVSASLRLTNAPFDIEFDCNDDGTIENFIGVGHLGTISALEEGTDIRPYSINLQLSGIPPALVAIALKEHYQGRRGNIYIAFLNDDNQLVGKPFLLFSGRMDNMPIEIGHEATITLTLQSLLADWERPRIIRYTSQSQAQAYPNDKFFEFVPQTASKEIIWGK